MKKALYGTTAMLAASMLSGQAMAVGAPATMANFNLTLGGFATFKVEYQSQAPGQNIGLPNSTTGAVLGHDADGTLTDQPRAYDVEFDSELYFLGSQKLANGTTMGFRFELETGGAELRNARGLNANGTDKTSTTETNVAYGAAVNPALHTHTYLDTRADLIDDNFIYLDGRWGKLTMGGTRDQRLEIGIARTYSAAGAIQIDTDVEGVAGNNRVQSGSFTGTIDLNNAVNKLIWELPAMGGFRLAVNWSPDNQAENTTTITQKDDDGAGGEDFDFAGQWAGTIGGIATRISAGYLTQSAEDQRPTSTIANGLNVDPATNLEQGTMIANNTRWRVGADFKTGPITVGGYYAHLQQNGPAATPEETAVRYGLGVTYAVGVWEFGGAWEHATQDVAQRNIAGSGNSACSVFGCIIGVDSGTRWDIGVKYSGLGGGKVVTVGYRQDRFLAIADGLRDSGTRTAAATNDKKVDNESLNKTIAVKLDWTVGPGFVQTFGYENYSYTHHIGAGNATTGGPIRKTSSAIVAQTALTF